jgi:glycosyltransferase involved in cell wall biosynthesis
MQVNSSQPLRALVSTIEPIDGGVPTMTRWICKLLEELNIIPVLAWYAPWRTYPHMSIPMYKLFTGRRPQSKWQYAFDKYDGHAIGCWLPELEFTHYLPGRQWTELINLCNLHIAVSGNSLCASPYVHLNLPFLAWIATPWNADRKDRVREFSFSRKLLDASINKPLLCHLEKKILRSPYAQILALSTYTSRELELLSGRDNYHVMYMPVDTSVFFPARDKTVEWKIGFSGRYADPRKNLRLLLSAVQILVRKGCDVQVVLVGERKASVVMPLINELGLSQFVTCLTNLPARELASILQTLDVFTIPSHQEGLCIAALEAMACGVPVISTRCGGPEDYVKSGITGELVEQSPEVFAETIENICRNRFKRNHLSEGAVEWISRNASQDVSRRQFRQHLFCLARRRGYVLD